MSTRSKCRFFLAVAAFAAAAPLAAQQKDLTYHTIPPCYIANTYVAGGQFAPNETRTYNVVGNGSLAGQGGSASGCGIPGFSNGIARVQAVAINIVAFNPTGAGHLLAVAADTGIANTTYFLTFGPWQTIANTGPVAVAQTPGVGDIKINYAVSGGHIVASVVGYYTRFGETITVGPGSTPAASGTALLNALTSIADNSASKPYLIKLEPGVYDVGSTMVVMKPYVDIEGSGQQSTIIQGVGNDGGDNPLLIGIVKGASNAELRNLQVKSQGTGFAISIGLVIESANTRVKDVTLVSSGASNNWGSRVANGVVSGLNPIFERVTIEVQGGDIAYGIVNAAELANTSIRDSRITVAGAGDAYGLYATQGLFKETHRVQADVSGTYQAYGYYVQLLGFSGTIKLTESTLNATSTGTAYGVGFVAGLVSGAIVRSTLTASGAQSYGFSGNGFSQVTIDHSELVGQTATVVGGIVNIGATRLSGGPVSAFSSTTCAGVYDENYTFYASTCP